MQSHKYNTKTAKHAHVRTHVPSGPSEQYWLTNTVGLSLLIHFLLLTEEYEQEQELDKKLGVGFRTEMKAG